MWKLWKTRADEGVSQPNLQALVDSIRDIDGRVKALEIEWGATYKKISRLVGHITKSAAIDALPEPQTPPQKPNGELRTRTPYEMTRDEIANLRV